MHTAPADPLTAAFTEHQAFVRERLRGLGVAPAELDDATQDVFEVLARRIADLDPDRPVRAWLAGVARKVARRHRERGRRVLLPIDEARLSSGAGSSEQRAAEVDARAVLDAFMAELDPDRWAVFVLAEIEGLRGTEIAAELDLNLNTVYARLRSARAAFERTLKRHHAREQRGRARAWMLVPGAWPRRWRWASLGLGTLGLAGAMTVGLVALSRGGCAGGDPLGPTEQESAAVVVDDDNPDLDLARTRPLPAWMLDADHEARTQEREHEDGDPQAWHEAGWGFTDTRNGAGERFQLTHERRYRLAGDRLILVTTFTGDDDVAADGIEARVELDGFELVHGQAQTEVSLAPAEVQTHTLTLRAVRAGPVALTSSIVIDGEGKGARRLGFVAEAGRLRQCEDGEREAVELANDPSRAPEPSTTITVTLVNECRVAARFVLGSPAYPEVRPALDSPIHELAAGTRETLAIEPGEWILRADEDGQVGGGVSTTDDGARIVFSGHDDTCERLTARPEVEGQPRSPW